MTHLNLLGSWVRLPDGRSGHVAASGIDGLVVIVDGQMVTVKPSEVTAIPAPTAAEHPEADVVVIPPGVSVMRNGQWQ
jgi:hypothetical protein